MKAFHLKVTVLAVGVITAFSVLAHDIKPPTQDVKKIMDAGADGTYPFSENCPSDITDGKDTVSPAAINAYIEKSHKAILDKNPKADPLGSANKIRAILDASVSMVCQAEGKAGKPLPTKTPDRWIKELGAYLKGDKNNRRNSLADAIVDYGFFLQKNGDHQMALNYLKPATLLDPSNELGFLYAGDSLWVLKKQEEAKVYYKKYIIARKIKYGPHGTFAPQVEERLHEGKISKPQ